MGCRQAIIKSDEQSDYLISEQQLETNLESTLANKNVEYKQSVQRQNILYPEVIQQEKANQIMQNDQKSYSNAQNSNTKNISRQRTIEELLNILNSSQMQSKQRSVKNKKKVKRINMQQLEEQF